MPKKSREFLKRSRAAKRGWDTRRKREAFERKQASYRKHSEASRRGYEARWERIYSREVDPWAQLGRQGRQFIERKYGPRYDEGYRDTWDGFEDFADTEIEY